MPLICSSQMFSKTTVVNVVCGQSYVISIQAKINLSQQLVCNHGNYSVAENCVCSGLIIWQRVQAVVKYSHMVDLYLLSVTPFSFGMWDDQLQ